MRTEQLKLNHMYEISKGNAPDYMTSKFEKSTNIQEQYVGVYYTKN